MAVTPGAAASGSVSSGGYESRTGRLPRCIRHFRSSRQCRQGRLPMKSLYGSRSFFAGVSLSDATREANLLRPCSGGNDLATQTLGRHRGCGLSVDSLCPGRMAVQQ
jgi:hypothetical protein